MRVGALTWLVAILAAALVLNGCAPYHQAAQSAANELRGGIVLTVQVEPLPDQCRKCLLWPRDYQS